MLILFFIFYAPTFTSAQSTFVDRLNTSLTVGYQVGGQGENRNFVTKNGANIQLNLLYQFNKFISVGPGIGIAKLEQEKFAPIFISIKGLLKDKINSPYLRARFGYALGSNQEIAPIDAFDFNGGIYFTAGWGYQWSIGEKLAIDFEINMEFQQSSIEFISFSGQTFENDIQNYFLSFKTGINF